MGAAPRDGRWTGAACRRGARLRSRRLRPDQSQARLAAIRETIDLIEIDLAAMIRDVQRAADAVRGGTRATSPRCSARSASRASSSPPWRRRRPRARRILRPRPRSSPSPPDEIGRQVREAGTLTDEAGARGDRRRQERRRTEGLLGRDRQRGEPDRGDRQADQPARAQRHDRGGARGRGRTRLRGGRAGGQVALQRDAERDRGDRPQDRSAAARRAGIDRGGEPHHGGDRARSGRCSRRSRARSRSRSRPPASSRAARPIPRASSRRSPTARPRSRQPRARAEQSGVAIDRSGADAAGLAAKLQTRFVTFLRQTEIGDRRRHDRLPCDLAVVLRQGGRDDPRRRPWTCPRAACWCAPRTARSSPIGTSVEADLSGIGRVRARIVGRSSLGLHVEFAGLDAGVEHALHERLDAIRAENKEFVDRAVDAAAMVSMAFEEAVDVRQADARRAVRHRLCADRGHQPAAVPHPRARRAGAGCCRRSRNRCSPSDKRMTFCAAVDRNGYLPVHNRIYSQAAEAGRSGVEHSRTAATAASSTIAPACARRATCAPI